MNISQLIKGVVGNIKPVKAKNKTAVDKIGNFFSQEAKDERFIQRAKHFEKLNKKRLKNLGFK